MKFRASLLAAALTVMNASAGESETDSLHKRIDAIKGSDTNAWRKIPWASSLLPARRASEREKQPLFLFTHDGNIETGRC
jgi:hypothetical protein